MVEFFDYNCGFCRRALPEVVKLVDSDDKVRLVLKELPIFGEDSEAAAKAALAAGSRANISRCTRSCSPSPARPTRTRRCKIAGELGLDVRS